MPCEPAYRAPPGPAGRGGRCEAILGRLQSRSAAAAIHSDGGPAAGRGGAPGLRRTGTGREAAQVARHERSVGMGGREDGKDGRTGHEVWAMGMLCDLGGTCNSGN